MLTITIGGMLGSVGTVWAAGIGAMRGALLLRTKVGRPYGEGIGYALGGLAGMVAFVLASPFVRQALPIDPGTVPWAVALGLALGFALTLTAGFCIGRLDRLDELRSGRSTPVPPVGQ